MEKETVGKKIRELRKRQHISGKELAEKLGISAAAVSKFERGLLRPTEELINKTSRALKLNADDEYALKQLGAFFNSQFKMWSNTAEEIERNQELIGQREEKSINIRSYWNQIIPGLLQSKGYMESVVRSFYNDEDRQVQNIMKARMKRQKVLQKKRRSFVFVLGEASLLSVVGSGKIMAEQLVHLGWAMKNLPSVEIRVLPFDKPLKKVPLHHFILYDEKTVEIEVNKGQVDLWTEEDVSFHIDLMNYLVSVSLNPAQSKNCIEQVLKKFA